MECCAGMADDGDAAGSMPCHCALNPVPPNPMVHGASPAPTVVPVAPPLAAAFIDAPAATKPAASVAARARSGPLNLLFSVLLV